jgi:SAM-dependent methyltransferase
MDLPAERLAGALILDAGCGNGRLTAAMAGFGCEVVGMDLSRSIERAHLHRAALAGDRAPFVHFVQGNLMEPPLARGIFDHVHSSGVLHHTPDTEASFRSILRLARPGAHVHVQLYRTREAWVGLPNRMIRSVTSRLPVGLLFRLCYAAAPVHAGLVRIVARLRGEATPIGAASRREQAVSLFDNYSPRYQWRYHPHEVDAMFRRGGLSAVKDVTLENEKRHMVAFVGTKEVSDASTDRSLGTAA